MPGRSVRGSHWRPAGGGGVIGAPCQPDGGGGCGGVIGVPCQLDCGGGGGGAGGGGAGAGGGGGGGVPWGGGAPAYLTPETQHVSGVGSGTPPLSQQRALGPCTPG